MMKIRKKYITDFKNIHLSCIKTQLSVLENELCFRDQMHEFILMHKLDQFSNSQF